MIDLVTSYVYFYFIKDSKPIQRYGVQKFYRFLVRIFLSMIFIVKENENKTKTFPTKTDSEIRTTKITCYIQGGWFYKKWILGIFEIATKNVIY